MAKEKPERRSPMSEALEAKKMIEALAEDKKNIIDIDISLIDPPPFHDRTSYSESAIHVLASNIKAVGGLLSPVIVRMHNGRYQRIAGFRRIEAMKLLGRSTVPAIVVNVSDDTATLMMLSENVLRENLNPYDEFVAILTLSAKYLQMDDAEVKAFVYRIKNYRSGNLLGISDEDKENINRLNEVLQKIGKFTYDGILNRMRMLALPDKLKDAIKNGMSYLSAIALSRLKDEHNFDALIKKAIDANMSTREIEAMYREIKNKNGKTAAQKKNPFSGFSVKDKEWGQIEDSLKSEIVEKMEEIRKMLGRS